MERIGVRTVATDVLVIGTGGAGLRTAIAAREAGVSVTVVGKRGRGDAHTVLAAGGINAALGTVDPEDSWQQHFADTYRESYGLSDPRVVEILTREAPAAVLELADWGCAFARAGDGRLDQRYFGAHTYRRTCYAGDQTGQAIIATLVSRVDALGIPILERQYATRLLVSGDGECVGVLAFDLMTGERTAYLCGALVLCTGGHTALWHRNTSRGDENWGDGMALALRAGASLMDMELVQFHPTGLVWPEDVAGTLVTEAVRGEGGRLTNALGERFMARYDAARMELSTRDRVALANYAEIMGGRGGPHGGVFLDISHRGLDAIMEKLPKMYRQLRAFEGLDISKEPMEVAPTAHYSMGGVVVEAETHATQVPGLFAVGECAGGAHGANRLGGNSLVDLLVFGRRAGLAAAARAGSGGTRHKPARAIAEAGEELDAMIGRMGNKARALQGALQDLMWERAGVVRDEAGLRTGLEGVAELHTSVENVEVRRGSVGVADLAQVLDLRAGVDTAEATLRGAIERAETRGCHNRSDFPDLDPGLRVNFRVSREPSTGRLAVEAVPVPPVPGELSAWASARRVVPAGDQLLE